MNFLFGIELKSRSQFDNIEENCLLITNSWQLGSEFNTGCSLAEAVFWVYFVFSTERKNKEKTSWLEHLSVIAGTKIHEWKFLRAWLSTLFASHNTPPLCNIFFPKNCLEGRRFQNKKPLMMLLNTLRSSTLGFIISHYWMNKTIGKMY